MYDSASEALGVEGTHRDGITRKRYGYEWEMQATWGVIKCGAWVLAR